MKQKVVIRVSMPCERSRSRAMALVARADGVISMEIAGDARDKLEVVGDGVDAVRLVGCLRRKLGHADIFLVEEVNDKNAEEEQNNKYTHCYHDCYDCHHHHHPPAAAADGRLREAQQQLPNHVT